MTLISINILISKWMFLRNSRLKRYNFRKIRGTYANLPGERKVLNRKFKSIVFGYLVTLKPSFDNLNCISKREISFRGILLIFKTWVSYPKTWVSWPNLGWADQSILVSWSQLGWVGFWVSWFLGELSDIHLILLIMLINIICNFRNIFGCC